MATNPDELFADLVPKQPGAAPVYGAPPVPKDPKDQFTALPKGDPRYRPDFPNAQVNLTTNEVNYGPQVKQEDSDEAKKATALDAARNTIQSIEKARGLVSNWSTGLGGAVGKLYPGSDQAKQLDSIIHQELRGNIFQNWVAQLKAESTTGTSGIGRIMQSEIPLVTGALGALDPVAMGREGTLQSFDQIENRVLRTAARLNGENPDDPAVIAKYQKQFGAAPTATGNNKTPPAPPGSGGGGPSGGGDGGGGGTSIGVTDLTSDQKKAYAGFWQTNPNPTPDQLTTFLGSIGIKNVSNAGDIIKAEKAGRGYSTAAINTTYQDKVKQRVKLERDTGIAQDPATTLAIQGATAGLSDEAAGVGHALAETTLAPFTGHFDPIGDYQFGRDVERQRIADARQQLGYGGTAIDAVSSLASANPTEAVAALGGKAAAAAAGKAGAVSGALSGFGYGEGTGESITGAGVGALGGHLLGRYGGAVVQKVLPRGFRPPQGMAPEVADAAQAEGVDLIRPMVDPASRPKFGALESDPTAQPIVRGAADKVRGQIEDRVSALSDGTPLDTEAAGNVIQSGARQFIQRSKGVANTLYNRARSLSGDARFVPQNAIDAVEAQIAALRKNPETNAGEINFLEGLHSDLATPGGKTIEELRQLRQSLRGRINEQNLGATQAEARAAQALDATQLDAAANLPKGAADAYRRADSYYRERAVHIDDVLNRFLGGNVEQGQARLSGEQAFSRLKSMTSPGGDGRRLAALMRDLDPNERQDIAATIAQSLGRRSPDEPFSTALFVSQTRKLSPSARRTIFGPDGAQSIDNLRTLSKALNDAGGDINRSRSTTVANRMSPIRTAAKTFIAGITGLGPAAGGFAVGGAEGGAIGLATGAATMAGAKGLKVLSARAMVNPRVSRWLAESADVATQAQAKEQVRKLGVIIAREPVIANELKPIYDALQHRLDLPLAADPNQSGGSDNEQR